MIASLTNARTDARMREKMHAIAKRLESGADAAGILVPDVVRRAVAGKDFTFGDGGAVSPRSVR